MHSPLLHALLRKNLQDLPFKPHHLLSPCALYLKHLGKSTAASAKACACSKPLRQAHQNLCLLCKSSSYNLKQHSRPWSQQSYQSIHADAFHRLCQPWITLTILRGTFGEVADEVADRYLVQHIPGRYIFTPQYDRLVSLYCHSQKLS